MRAMVRTLGTVLETDQALFRVTLLPAVEAGPADPVVAACRRHTAGDFLGVTQDRQAVLCPSALVCVRVTHLLRFDDGRTRTVRRRRPGTTPAMARRSCAATTDDRSTSRPTR